MLYDVVILAQQQVTVKWVTSPSVWLKQFFRPIQLINWVFKMLQIVSKIKYFKEEKLFNENDMNEYD